MKNTSRIVAGGLVTLALVAVACHREPIGGECSGALACAEGAERCFKMENATTGVCSKHCTADAECGAIARCKEVRVTHTGGVYGATGVTMNERWCLPRGR
jgi:hypothetical protein